MKLSARSQIDQIPASAYFQLIPEIIREITKKLMDRLLETDENDDCGKFKGDLMNIQDLAIPEFIKRKELTGDDINNDVISRDFQKKTKATLASVAKAERNKELGNYLGSRISYTEFAEILDNTSSNLKKTFGSHSENGAKAVFFNVTLNSLIVLENKRLYLLGLFTNFSQTYSEEEYVDFVNLCIQLDREGVLKINEGGKK